MKLQTNNISLEQKYNTEHKSYHHIKEPGSAITHFIGMLMAIFAAVPLLMKAAHEPSRIYIISLANIDLGILVIYGSVFGKDCPNQTNRNYYFKCKYALCFYVQYLSFILTISICIR